MCSYTYLLLRVTIWNLQPYIELRPPFQNCAFLVGSYATQRSLCGIAPNFLGFLQRVRSIGMIAFRSSSTSESDKHLTIRFGIFSFICSGSSPQLAASFTRPKHHVAPFSVIQENVLLKLPSSKNTFFWTIATSSLVRIYWSNHSTQSLFVYEDHALLVHPRLSILKVQCLLPHKTWGMLFTS